MQKIEKLVSYNLETITGRVLKRTDPRGLRWDLDLGWLCEADGCEREAMTMNLLPYAVRTKSVAFFCREHNAGGWDLPVLDLLAEPERWIAHLEESKFDGAKTVRLMFQRLGWDWTTLR